MKEKEEDEEKNEKICRQRTNKQTIREQRIQKLRPL